MYHGSLSLVISISVCFKVGTSQILPIHHNTSLTALDCASSQQSNSAGKRTCLETDGDRELGKSGFGRLGDLEPGATQCIIGKELKSDLVASCCIAM